jgi:peptide/nickel transport system permease protein
MTNFIVRRLLGMIPMLFCITVFTFLLMHAAPGNAIDALVDPRIKDRTALIARLKEANGLNHPLYVQYWLWLKNFVEGQWGFSFALHEPVTAAVLPALKNTLYLAVIAEVFILLFGIPLGIQQSRNPYGKFDSFTTAVSVTLFSIPFYIVAIVLIYFLAIKLSIFPAQNATGSGANSGSLLDHFYHALLPALAIAITTSTVYSRYTRGSMLDVARMDFTRTAYAKGLKESIVFRKHVFRNGMIPIITQFGYDIGGLVGGAVILEGLFAYQGMGYLAIQAAEQRDYNVILATTIIFAVGVLLGNLVADILYAIADPRIRYD